MGIDKDSSFNRFLRSYLGEIVYGGNDGIITTFAVISGVAGAKLSLQAMLIIAVVSLFADGFSMAASSFLSIRSKREADGLAGKNIAPLRHACATFIAFILFGVTPLLGLLISPLFNYHFFFTSSCVTGITLFVLGAVRSRVSHRKWIMTGLENLTIGTVASLVAYGCGYFMAKVL